MTDEELIARLRDGIADVEACMAEDAEDAEHTGERVDLLKYAVAIDIDDARALIVRIEALIAEVEAMQDRLDVANKSRAHVMALAMKRQTRAEKAEAERDAAVGMLIELEKRATETSRLGAVTGGHWTRLTIACLNARTTLAKIKEGGL